jgi:hypothetical protein
MLLTPFKIILTTLDAWDRFGQVLLGKQTLWSKFNDSFEYWGVFLNLLDKAYLIQQ